MMVGFSCEYKFRITGKRVSVRCWPVDMPVREFFFSIGWIEMEDLAGCGQCHSLLGREFTLDYV